MIDPVGQSIQWKAIYFPLLRAWGRRHSRRRIPRVSPAGADDKPSPGARWHGICRGPHPNEGALGDLMASSKGGLVGPAQPDRLVRVTAEIHRAALASRSRRGRLVRSRGKPGGRETRSNPPTLPPGPRGGAFRRVVAAKLPPTSAFAVDLVLPKRPPAGPNVIGTLAGRAAAGPGRADPQRSPSTPTRPANPARWTKTGGEPVPADAANGGDFLLRPAARSDTPAANLACTLLGRGGDPRRRRQSHSLETLENASTHTSTRRKNGPDGSIFPARTRHGLAR